MGTKLQHFVKGASTNNEPAAREFSYLICDPCTNVFYNNYACATYQHVVTYAHCALPDMNALVERFVEMILGLCFLSVFGQRKHNSYTGTPRKQSATFHGGTLML